ncbi:chromatin assembly factor 1 subunit B, putative [Trypanosoma brucei gambiense DAL972]|uniref:Chromatin assembly factor 1 subunit B, putative n=2 Tax=Trypanosoma brucei TaxID=5691 RepID=D0A3C6_TRYB9|nr:chromatin assembly factor 1 subunit B, putative [Trypanosoma brucei gambiense DAL972]RHW68823.1 chromatin assembly factor 1 subunit B [Trypanosoma brucei equiperdum]CBH15770.1 chromatin assembly factor 1 subunit B, putative [Trypanosoma brucei gambiense DAL972]|eukprot:XP_011778034.1 chromatin assembly factor 1 subunit B, putative [Trypanosoma brucei gambiense DAL972]
MATSIQQNPLRVRTLEVLWHWREIDDEALQFGLQGGSIEGIVSIDYNRVEDRIVTSGGDRYIRLWNLNIAAIDRWLKNSESGMEDCVQFICGGVTPWMPLTARWAPNGRLIASGHCDGKICLWWKESGRDGEPEQWKDYRHLSGHVIDVHDVCFSPDSRYLLSAGGDGTVVLHDLEGSTMPVVQLQEAHSKFCRGVAWDPWMHYVASCGSGPALYIMQGPKHGAKRASLVSQRKAQGDFIGESCSASYRRLAWSPDGAILAVPYGKVSQHKHSRSACSGGGSEDATAGAAAGEDRWKNSMVHCVYMYIRNAPDKVAARLTVRGDAEVRGVQWAPCFLEPIDEITCNEEQNDTTAAEVSNQVRKSGPTAEEKGSWGPADYRMALAVWTADAVMVYTTDSEVRHSDFTDLHMRSIYDVAWSPDASYLLTAGLDGYITVISTGGSLGVAHRLPLFSKKPTTRRLCTVLQNVKTQSETLGPGRGATKTTNATTKKEPVGGEESENASSNTVVHAPVKKKKKLEPQAQEMYPAKEEPDTAVSLGELSKLMDNLND